MKKQIEQLATRLAAELSAHGKTLAVAESCTGGWLAKVLTDLPGSSAWFLGGVVSYSNAAKQRLLSVDDHCLETFGAVSEPVAKQMAAGAQAAFSSSFAVSTTGIAGPSGGSLDKPVGLVCFALKKPQGEPVSSHRVFEGDRERIRLQAVLVALQLLIEAVAD